MRAASLMLCVAVVCAGCAEDAGPAGDAASLVPTDAPLVAETPQSATEAAPGQETTTTAQQATTTTGAPDEPATAETRGDAAPVAPPTASTPDQPDQPEEPGQPEPEQPEPEQPEPEQPEPEQPEELEQPVEPERLGYRDRARFVSASAPQWPFRGLVQLWPARHRSVEAVHEGESVPGVVTEWALRYWSWDPAMDSYPQVDLTGMEISCLGRVALVVHAERGIEVGGAPGAVNAAFFVPWGGTARRAEEPSEQLLAAGAARGGPSNVAVSTRGDLVQLGEGPDARSYAMRDPLRAEGSRWDVQARHDGELFLLTVHPAHLDCYSGITWLSLAATGDSVACGANTAATVFLSPSQHPAGELVLPDPTEIGTYLSCAPRLDLGKLPLTPQRQLLTN